MQVSLHNCDDMKIRLYMPSNSNMIQLNIERNSGPVEICLYGLPIAVTNALIEALGLPRYVSNSTPDNVKENRPEAHG